MADKTVEFEDVPEVKRETDAAILCVVEGNEMWIPKSQIDDDSEVYKKGTSGKLIVTEWIALQKGLI